MSGNKGIVAAFLALGAGAAFYLSRRKDMIDTAKDRVNTVTSSSNNPNVPGEDKGIKKRALETGANLLQGFAPVNSIHQHICGLHGYAHDIKRQVIAHHYCSHLNNDVCQCVIYDGDEKGARLIGIEYIISEKLYNNLPPEEQQLWHSHVHEVKGGLINCPYVPMIAEHEVMKDIVKTYGKTFHTWQVDRGDPLPLGVPQLMMAITDNSLIQNKDYFVNRDKKYNVSTDDLIKNRANLEGPKGGVHPNADPWEKGKIIEVHPVINGKVQATTTRDSDK
ncbi:hypothetical protein ABK040_004760 [Willaertia magna]